MVSLPELSAEVGRVLVAQHFKLATVESCTGGWIARTGMERTEQYLFKGDREAVRRQSVIEALSGLIRFLEVESSP